MLTTRLPRCLSPESFVAARPRRLKWSGAGFPGPRATFGTRRGRRASGIVHIPPPGDSKQFAEVERPNSSSPNRGVDGCGQPVSECRPHGPSAPNHRLIPVAYRYPLGLKQSPGGKARARPRNPRLEAAPGGEELDRDGVGLLVRRLHASAPNRHTRRSSKSPDRKGHPDPAPGPRGAERREMSFKRGLIKPENLCGTLTAVQ